MRDLPEGVYSIELSKLTDRAIAYGMHTHEFANMIVEDDLIQDLLPEPHEWQEFKGEILFFLELPDDNLCIKT